ncbi:hypothetical protein [Dactylosporangium sp. CA-092794]|uniref:hypothetical protein n=1 Tax=Dactylosporangium sp. CA-092794 TaxID=3239929 RepID=UPI003D8F285F
MARLLGEQFPEVDGAVVGLAPVWGGASGRHFQSQYFDKFQGVWKDLADAADRFAVAGESAANELEFAQLMIIVIVAITVLEWAVGAALWMFGGAEFAAAATVVGREALSVVLRRLLTEMSKPVLKQVLKTVAKGAFKAARTFVAADVAAQGIQLGLGHRDGFDYWSTVKSAGSGVAVGVLGSGLGPLGERALQAPLTRLAAAGARLSTTGGTGIQRLILAGGAVALRTAAANLRWSMAGVVNVPVVLALNLVQNGFDRRFGLSDAFLKDPVGEMVLAFEGGMMGAGLHAGIEGLGRAGRTARIAVTDRATGLAELGRQRDTARAAAADLAGIAAEDRAAAVQQRVAAAGQELAGRVAAEQAAIAEARLAGLQRGGGDPAGIATARDQATHARTVAEHAKTTAEQAKTATTRADQRARISTEALQHTQQRADQLDTRINRRTPTTDTTTHPQTEPHPAPADTTTHSNPDDQGHPTTTDTTSRSADPTSRSTATSEGRPATADTTSHTSATDTTSRSDSGEAAPAPHPTPEPHTTTEPARTAAAPAEQTPGPEPTPTAEATAGAEAAAAGEGTTADPTEAGAPPVVKPGRSGPPVDGEALSAMPGAAELDPIVVQPLPDLVRTADDAALTWQKSARDLAEAHQQWSEARTGASQAYERYQRALADHPGDIRHLAVRRAENRWLDANDNVRETAGTARKLQETHEQNRRALDQAIASFAPDGRPRPDLPTQTFTALIGLVSGSEATDAALRAATETGAQLDRDWEHSRLTGEPDPKIIADVDALAQAHTILQLQADTALDYTTTHRDQLAKARLNQPLHPERAYAILDALRTAHDATHEAVEQLPAARAALDRTTAALRQAHERPNPGETDHRSHLNQLETEHTKAQTIYHRLTAAINDAHQQFETLAEHLGQHHLYEDAATHLTDLTEQHNNLQNDPNYPPQPHPAPTPARSAITIALRPHRTDADAATPTDTAGSRDWPMAAAGRPPVDSWLHTMAQRPPDPATARPPQDVLRLLVEQVDGRLSGVGVEDPVISGMRIVGDIQTVDVGGTPVVQLQVLAERHQGDPLSLTVQLGDAHGLRAESQRPQLSNDATVTLTDLFRHMTEADQDTVAPWMLHTLTHEIWEIDRQQHNESRSWLTRWLPRADNTHLLTADPLPPITGRRPSDHDRGGVGDLVSAVKTILDAPDTTALTRAIDSADTLLHHLGLDHSGPAIHVVDADRRWRMVNSILRDRHLSDDERAILAAMSTGGQRPHQLAEAPAGRVNWPDYQAGAVLLEAAGRLSDAPADPQLRMATTLLRRSLGVGADALADIPGLARHRSPLDAAIASEPTELAIQAPASSELRGSAVDAVFPRVSEALISRLELPGAAGAYQSATPLGHGLIRLRTTAGADIDVSVGRTPEYDTWSTPAEYDTWVMPAEYGTWGTPPEYGTPAEQRVEGITAGGDGAVFRSVDGHFRLAPGSGLTLAEHASALDMLLTQLARHHEATLDGSAVLTPVEAARAERLRADIRVAAEAGVAADPGGTRWRESVRTFLDLGLHADDPTGAARRAAIWADRSDADPTWQWVESLHHADALPMQRQRILRELLDERAGRDAGSPDVIAARKAESLLWELSGRLEALGVSVERVIPFAERDLANAAWRDLVDGLNAEHLLAADDPEGIRQRRLVAAALQVAITHVGEALGGSRQVHEVDNVVAAFRYVREQAAGMDDPLYQDSAGRWLLAAPVDAADTVPDSAAALTDGYQHYRAAVLDSRPAGDIAAAAEAFRTNVTTLRDFHAAVRDDLEHLQSTDPGRRDDILHRQQQHARIVERLTAIEEHFADPNTDMTSMLGQLAADPITGRAEWTELFRRLHQDETTGTQLAPDEAGLVAAVKRHDAAVAVMDAWKAFEEQPEPTLPHAFVDPDLRAWGLTGGVWQLGEHWMGNLREDVAAAVGAEIADRMPLDLPGQPQRSPQERVTFRNNVRDAITATFVALGGREFGRRLASEAGIVLRVPDARETVHPVTVRLDLADLSKAEFLRSALPDPTATDRGVPTGQKMALPSDLLQFTSAGRMLDRTSSLFVPVPVDEVRRVFHLAVKIGLHYHGLWDLSIDLPGTYKDFVIGVDAGKTWATTREHVESAVTAIQTLRQDDGTHGHFRMPEAALTVSIGHDGPAGPDPISRETPIDVVLGFPEPNLGPAEHAEVKPNPVLDARNIKPGMMLLAAPGADGRPERAARLLEVAGLIGMLSVESVGGMDGLAGVVIEHLGPLAGEQFRNGIRNEFTEYNATLDGPRLIHEGMMVPAQSLRPGGRAEAGLTARFEAHSVKYLGVTERTTAKEEHRVSTTVEDRMKDAQTVRGFARPKLDTADHEAIAGREGRVGGGLVAGRTLRREQQEVGGNGFGIWRNMTADKTNVYRFEVGGELVARVFSDRIAASAERLAHQGAVVLNVTEADLPRFLELLDTVAKDEPLEPELPQIRREGEKTLHAPEYLLERLHTGLLTLDTLAGPERFIDRIFDELDAMRAANPWMAELSDMDQIHLFSALRKKLGWTTMMSLQDEWFPRDGRVSVDWSREVPGGRERYHVVARAEFVGEPVVDTVREGTAAMLPVSYSESGNAVIGVADARLGLNISAKTQTRAGPGPQDGVLFGALSGNPTVGGARVTTTGAGAKMTNVLIHASDYKGDLAPVWQRLEWHLDIEVRHESNLAEPGWRNQIERAAEGFSAAEAHSHLTMPGLMRGGMPAGLALDQPVAGPLRAEASAPADVRPAPPRTERIDGRPPETDSPFHDLGPATIVDTPDIVAGIAGGQDAARIIQKMLKEAGFSDDAVAPVTDYVGPTQVQTHVQRDPQGAIRFVIDAGSSLRPRLGHVEVKVFLHQATETAQTIDTKPMTIQGALGELSGLEANAGLVTVAGTAGSDGGSKGGSTLAPTGAQGSVELGATSIRARFTEALRGGWTIGPKATHTAIVADAVYEIKIHVTEPPRGTDRIALGRREHVAGDPMETHIRVRHGAMILRDLSPSSEPRDAAVPAELRSSWLPAQRTTIRAGFEEPYDDRGLNPIEQRVRDLMATHAPELLRPEWTPHEDGGLVATKSGLPLEVHRLLTMSAFQGGGMEQLRSTGVRLHLKGHEITVRVDTPPDTKYEWRKTVKHAGEPWTDGGFGLGRDKRLTGVTRAEPLSGGLGTGGNEEAGVDTGFKVGGDGYGTRDRVISRESAVAETKAARRTPAFHPDVAHQYEGKVSVVVTVDGHEAKAALWDKVLINDADVRAAKGPRTEPVVTRDPRGSFGQRADRPLTARDFFDRGITLAEPPDPAGLRELHRAVLHDLRNDSGRVLAGLLDRGRTGRFRWREPSLAEAQLAHVFGVPFQMVYFSEMARDAGMEFPGLMSSGGFVGRHGDITIRVKLSNLRYAGEADVADIRQENHRHGVTYNTNGSVLAANVQARVVVEIPMEGAGHEEGVRDKLTPGAARFRVEGRAADTDQVRRLDVDTRLQDLKPVRLTADVHYEITVSGERAATAPVRLAARIPGARRLVTGEIVIERTLKNAHRFVADGEKVLAIMDRLQPDGDGHRLPNGIGLIGGRLFPRDGDPVQAAQALAAVPRVEKGITVSAEFRDGGMIVEGENLAAAEFARRLLLGGEQQVTLLAPGVTHEYAVELWRSLGGRGLLVPQPEFAVAETGVPSIRDTSLEWGQVLAVRTEPGQTRAEELGHWASYTGDPRLRTDPDVRVHGADLGSALADLGGVRQEPKANTRPPGSGSPDGGYLWPLSYGPQP